MNRDDNKKVHVFFKYNADTKMSTCNVCGLKLAGKHITNKRRHLTAKHRDIFEGLENIDTSVQAPKKKKISYETNEESIESSIIKIVTTGGMPFMLLDSEGFREIVNPIYNALAMPPISSRNIISHVKVREESIKSEIKAIVKGKLLSLKIDVATRNEKVVLGVNLQMIHSTLLQSEIIVKTLGIVQLFHSHTGIYIKEQILQILMEYGIRLDQIFSVTSDNGKNMIKAVELLNDNATEEAMVDDDESVDTLMEKVESMDFPNIHLERCAAHTLELCVYDVNKQKEISEKINTCRQLCKALRTGKHRRSLIEQNINIPALDVSTKWNSTYTMLVKLFELKECIGTQLAVKHSIDWDWVKLYIDAFKHPYEITLKLQREKLLYTDFFILWMELKHKCEKSQNYFSIKLLTQLKIRESKLLENEELLSAIYMDPRINLILNDQQKMLAKENLKKILNRIFEIKQLNAGSNFKAEAPSPIEDLFSSNSNSDQGDTSFNLNNASNIKAEAPSPTEDLFSSNTNSDPGDTSLFSSYLDEMEPLHQIKTEPASDILNKIYIEIENFKVTYGRLPLNYDILKFYQEMKLKSPHLCELAHVVLAIPATQVSVERSFSALNFILTERESSLSPENINSLLVVKLNS